jgi:hypothetical protein
MANKLEDLVRVAIVLTCWLVGWLVTLFYLEQKTKRASTTNTFEVFEALFYLRAFEVFETLFLYLRVFEVFEALFFYSRVFEVFETLLF